MLNFKESGLIFSFGRPWAVRKYDTHRFYQALSGHGLKGVDFIGIAEGRLYLFEVKNYRRRQAWQRENPFDVVIAAPDELVGRVAGKVADSLRAVRAIGRYYERRWLLRLLRPVLLRLPAHWGDWPFWLQAYELCQGTGEQVVAVLWLETEQERSRLRAQILKGLRAALKGQVAEVALWPGGGQEKRAGLLVRPMP